MNILRAPLAWGVVVLCFGGLALADPPASAESPAASANNTLKVGKLRVGKILFLGNSITLHAPAPKIGWTGNWGMAASAPEKDYVHRLLARLNRATGETPRFMVRNIADFERNLTAFAIRETLKDELAFEADLIILAIGENASSPKTDEQRTEFSAALKSLFAELKRGGAPTLLVRSQFWADAEKDQLLKQACLEAEGRFVDISPLGKDPANYARAERRIEHEGVAGHPGDQGMAAIADSLWTAIQAAGKEEP